MKQMNLSLPDGEDARRVCVLPKVVGVGIAVKVEAKSSPCNCYLEDFFIDVDIRLLYVALQLTLSNSSTQANYTENDHSIFSHTLES